MQQRGLATLWGATALLILTSLWGWFSLQSVGSESTRSAQQMQAAQALAHAEALLETAVAQLEANYANPLPQADAQL
jgi:Tfp pilus assembly protein PilX